LSAEATVLVALATGTGALEISTRSVPYIAYFKQI